MEVVIEQPSYHTTGTCCHNYAMTTSFHCSMGRCLSTSISQLMTIINTCEGDSDLCTFTNIHHYTHDLNGQNYNKGLQTWNNYSTRYLNIGLHVSTCPQE